MRRGRVAVVLRPPSSGDGRREERGADRGVGGLVDDLVAEPV